MTLTWSEYHRGHRQMESYWQRGFNDAIAGRHEVLPNNDGPFCPANRGYLNGYHRGWQKRVEQFTQKEAE